MSWIRIDDAMPESLKVAPLSDAAFRAYITSICYCARNLTDGFVPNVVARKMAGRPRIVQELVPGLWEVAEGGYMVHDYLEYNPPREFVLAERTVKHEAKVRAGKAGAEKRWQGNSKPIAKGIANGIAKRKQNDGPVPHPLPHRSEEVVVEDVSIGQMRRNIFVLYDQYMGKPAVTAAIRPVLLQAEEDYPDECIRHCFLEAAKSSDGRRSWKYVEAILRRHETEGCSERKQMGGNAGRASQARNPDAVSAWAVYNGGFAPEVLVDGGATGSRSTPVVGGADTPGMEVR